MPITVSNTLIRSLSELPISPKINIAAIRSAKRDLNPTRGALKYSRLCRPRTYMAK